MPPQICKLYLYNNEHALALAHHNSHMRKFADFSRGWGIGEETFEFWSWLARQYVWSFFSSLSPERSHFRHRAFAELLEHGTRSTLKIPTHFSTSPPANAAAAAAAQALEGGQRGALELEAMRALGLNPNQALQHPGFYYYMSARCTERRRERFLSVARAEVRCYHLRMSRMVAEVWYAVSGGRIVDYRAASWVQQRAEGRPPCVDTRGQLQL